MTSEPRSSVLSSTPTRRTALLGLGALPLAFGQGSSKSKAGQQEEHERRAARVLEAAVSFGRGGGYDRSWSSSGSPVKITHNDFTVLRASDKGTYCCGFTFAVAMRALAVSGALADKSAPDLKAFQRRWFGATDVEKERERQCAVAVGALGVGREVPADDAMAGDFVQLWRKRKKPSGHSVLFLAWINVGTERVGLSYLSSQGSTDGIGPAVEFFAGASAGSGTVDPKRLWVARLDAASQR